MGSMDNEDPEAMMLQDDDNRPLMSSFDIASGGDDDKKSLSLWPRNYNGRRRLVIAGVCFLFAVAVFVKNSGKQFINMEKILWPTVIILVFFESFKVHSSLFLNVR